MVRPCLYIPVLKTLKKKKLWIMHFLEYFLYSSPPRYLNNWEFYAFMPLSEKLSQ